MAKTDVIAVNVLADRRPSISAPPTIYLREGQTLTDRTLVLFSGRPLANFLGYTVHNSAADVLRGTNPITSGPVPTITWLEASEPTQPNMRATLPLTIVAPVLPGTADRTYYIRWRYASTNAGARNAESIDTTRMIVEQHIPATIEVGDSFTVHENSNIRIPYRGNFGIPRRTAVNLSWHTSPSAAFGNTNRLTNIPWDPAQTGEWEVFNRGRNDFDGSITLRTPAVTSEQMFYGRLEIIQDGAVADFDTFTLIVRNTVVPSLSVGNHKGVEGQTITVPVNYMGGQPAPDRWELDWAPSQQRALNGNFLDANDPRRPTNIVYHQHATPRQGANPRTMNMRVTLPYVSRNETIWGRLTIVATDPVTNQPHYTHETFRLVIQNRVEAGIEFPDMATITEMTTDHEIQGYAWVGVPPATSMDATVHPNTGDATRDANPLTGAGEPSVRLSRTTLEVTDNPMEHQPVTLYFTAPDIQMDEDYGVRVDIVQAAITPDPT